jgi:N-acetylated-alpha-linked acidic dipeptidase
MKSVTAFLLTLALLTSTARAADDTLLAGYSAASARTQRDWEARFRAIPDPANLRAYMQRLTARPHHTGSPYDKDNADWLLSKLTEFGFDAKIETFDVLFPTPKERALELLEPTRFTARLAEPTEGATPPPTAPSAPSYHAYSIDGDVTAPLV